MTGLDAKMIDQLLTPEVMAAVDPVLTGLGLDVAERARESFTGGITWVAMFGSTAGPFQGIGGAAMTDFRLTVVHSPDAMILFAANERQNRTLLRRVRLFGVAPYDPAVLEDRDWAAFVEVQGFTYVPDGPV